MSYDMFGRTPEQAAHDRRMFWVGFGFSLLVLLVIFLPIMLGG